MKRLGNLAVAGCTIFLLCQCATQDEIKDLNYQVRAVNQKVEEVRSNTVDQMQKRQASSVNRIDEVQNDIMQLKATLEENSHQDTLLREQSKEGMNTIQSMLEKFQAENEGRLKLMEDRISQLERNLDTMSQSRIREAEQRARDAALKAEEARRKTVVAATSDGIVQVKPDNRKQRVDSGKVVESETYVTTPAERPVVKPDTPVSVDSAPGGDLFSQGVALYNSSNYAEAYKTFEKVLSQNPKGDQAAETLFYMGESLFGRGEYDLAILDYQKVISNHSQHKKTPAALLKQGMSFEKLTDHETAKIIYKKLIGEYPDSPEAETAEKQLNSLQ